MERELQGRQAGEWTGSTGPSLVGQPLNLMRCEEVSLITGGVPHGAVLLLLREPPSVFLQMSAPGPSLVAVADVLGIMDLFCGHLPWQQSQAFCPTWGHFLGCLLPALWTRAALPFCILHRRSLGSGREAVMFMAGVRHIFISVPSLATLAVPWAPGIRQALETCLLIGQIIVPIQCGYHKNT